jgi:DNA polymerase I
MSKVKRLLLIDGNNLAHRVYWANKNMNHKGENIACLYGFFKSLIGLRTKYDKQDYICVIAWDYGGSKRRKKEASDGVENGIIPSGYKANRDTNGEISEDLENIFAQMDQIREGLEFCKVLQVKIKGVEADDVIYSYAIKNKERGGQSIAVTSDQDYLQMISKEVKVFDPMKKILWTHSRFTQEYGFEPNLWVDYGAIMGDTSDNIHGVGGWGPKTAMKYVQAHGSIEEIRGFLSNQEKLSKKEQVFLDSKERLDLAYSLKQMDFIPEIPKTRFTKEYNVKDIVEFFEHFEFRTLIRDAWKLS